MWPSGQVPRYRDPLGGLWGLSITGRKHPDTLTLFRDPLNISKTTLEEKEGQREGGGRRLKERHASEHTQIFIIARTNQPPRALILSL